MKSVGLACFVLGLDFEVHMKFGLGVKCGVGVDIVLCLHIILFDGNKG